MIIGVGSGAGGRGLGVGGLGVKPPARETHVVEALKLG
jgi:hypothetical protein